MLTLLHHQLPLLLPHLLLQVMSQFAYMLQSHHNLTIHLHIMKVQYLEGLAGLESLQLGYMILFVLTQSLQLKPLPLNPTALLPLLTHILCSHMLT